jgi:hypothetical protein
MSDLTVQNVKIVVRRLEPQATGFLPRYRKLLSARRALGEFEKAQPEDIDEVYKLLAEHMTEPKEEPQKKAVLDVLSVDDLMKMFDEIMGRNTVNPPSGAA